MTYRLTQIRYCEVIRIFAQVCQGDTIVADVKNKMGGRSTTIHWHGLRQINTPWMDGVPMVTQCPIEECQIFRYTFLADVPGLDFYHSHDGKHRILFITLINIFTIIFLKHT